MVPFNGIKALLGTNPFASAVPMADGVPMILDMATSEVAKGKIRKALANEESIPLSWAVDKDGRSTTDPKAALESTICPIGGARAWGWL
jgi:LDH2 family malate/lactate/ureidoglycolate dehydrogenase